MCHFRPCCRTVQIRVLAAGPRQLLRLARRSQHEIASLDVTRALPTVSRRALDRAGHGRSDIVSRPEPMPSPVGHALGGIVGRLEWLFPTRRVEPSTLRTALDRRGLRRGARSRPALVHDHRGPAHSLGAAILVGALALSLITRNPPLGHGRRRSRGRRTCCSTGWATTAFLPSASWRSGRCRTSTSNRRCTCSPRSREATGSRSSGCAT